jgi:hypothetical protein
VKRVAIETISPDCCSIRNDLANESAVKGSEAPGVMPMGIASLSGRLNSLIFPLFTSRRPIFDVPLSQNHKPPSGPPMQM